MGEAATFDVIELFVNPASGNDAWSGKLSAPNADKTDGPFATIPAAQLAVRKLKDADGTLPFPVRVVLARGDHVLAEPLHFTHEDSGSPPVPNGTYGYEGPMRSVTYTSAKNGRAIITGGTRITGFTASKLNGKTVWTTHIPAVKDGSWNFTQLFVNRRRAARPVLPRDGKTLFRIAKVLGEVVLEGDIHKQLFTGQDAFEFAPGDLQAWRNTTDIEFVALHFWIETRANFASIDVATNTAKIQRKSRMRLTDDFGAMPAQFYVENVFEALDTPGQWYLDRPTGTLYYLPLPGEKIGTVHVVAPRLTQLVKFEGDIPGNKPVRYVRFENVTLSHSEWISGPELMTATPQAACHLPGAIVMRSAQHCALHNCEVSHVGSYAVEINGGSFECEVTRCDIVDLGGGGVKIWHDSPAKGERTDGGGGADMHATLTCKRISVADCVIADGGNRHHQAVGVLVGQCSGVQIVHNHIHHFRYSGVSVGWSWGYQEGHAYGNLVEYNHIHDIGMGMLSDMGAIYTLSPQPGTRIRYNLIHDVESRGYGGWGIYPDEGSSHILIENNVVYRTKSNGFHQHYGKDNIIRNNVFALGREAQIARSRLEPHDSFHFHHNIVLADNGGVIFSGNWKQNHATADDNLYYDVKKKAELKFADGDFAAWQKRGMDRHSRIADPLFLNVGKNDFRLKANSPALKMGFLPIDMSEVGPRV
jgi:hypothetical protein